MTTQAGNRCESFFTKHLGLRRSQSIVLKTRQQDLRWIQYIMLERTGGSEESTTSTNHHVHKRREPSYPRHIAVDRQIVRNSAGASSSGTKQLRAPIRRPRTVATRSVAKGQSSSTKDSDSAPTRRPRTVATRPVADKQASSTKDNDGWI